jgi:hypothetical protein
MIAFAANPGGRKEMCMRRSILMGVIALAVLALAPVAASAGPDEHFRDVGTFSDPDFCGTGQTVEGTFNVLVNLWILPEDPRDFSKITQSGKVMFTNPENGRTVLLSFAGRVTNTILEGDPFGLHTHLYTTAGLPEKIQTSHGAVLTRDAGLIAERITFDQGEVVDYSATWRGPHPEAESGFELFCEVMIPALGL